MQKIKYSFLDIKNNKNNSIIFLIQMIIVLLLVNFSISQITSISDGLNRISVLRNSESYVVVDSTANEKVNEILNNPESSLPKLKSMYEKMRNANCENQYTFFGYQMGMNDDGIILEQKTASKGFFDAYNIKVRHGRNFNPEDYENSSDIIPVIIGFNLSHTYSLNQVYSFKNGGSGEEFQGEVVGILPKNTVYPFLQNISSTIQLDNSYIIPLTNSMVANDFQVPDFDMAIANTIITTSDKSVLDEIVTESNKTNLFSLNFLSVQNAVSNYIDYMTPQIVYQLVTAIIILIFACIGMISHLITMISKQQKDYGIHILCGARIKDIILRLFIQVGIIIIASFVPCLLIMGLSKSLLITLLIELLISIVIMVFPMIKLYSLSIPQIIRRSE